MIGEDDIQNILQAPWRAMGTDGLLGGRPHPRAYGSCPRILGHYARDLGLLTLEEAIRKMTSFPAEILHLWICSHDPGHMWEAISPQPVLTWFMRLQKEF